MRWAAARARATCLPTWRAVVSSSGPWRASREASEGPVEQLHDQEGEPGRVLAKIEDVDEVLVLDGVDELRFPEESGHQIRVTRVLRVKYLDGHPLADPRLLGQVDRAHAPFTDQAHHSIASEDATDVWIRSGRRHAGSRIVPLGRNLKWEYHGAVSERFDR